MATVNKPGVMGGKEHIPLPPTGRLSHAPRQSTATQIRLKVIQGSVERLMGEVEELGEIKQFLMNLRNQMDDEANALHKMNDIAYEALSCEVVMPGLEGGKKGQLELMDSLPKVEIEEEDSKHGVKRTDFNSRSDVEGHATAGSPTGKKIKTEDSQTPIKIETDDKNVIKIEPFSRDL